MSAIHRSAVTCLAILCLVTLVQFIPSVHAGDALRVVSDEAWGSLKAASGDAGDGQGDPEQVAVPRMFIEPMAGFTSGRHLAPTRTAICRGTEVTLCQEVPVGATVTWGGISESARIGDDSFATKRLATVGEQVIVAVVETKDGDVFENSVVFDVVDITLDEIQIGTPTVVASELTMSDSMSNQETYKLYLARESIAQFRKVSLERQLIEATSDGRFGRRTKLPPSNALERYRTSTSRTIRYGVSTDPPGFSPLMEWRVGDVAWGLGATIPIRVDEPGVHVISVGPPARPRQVELETYSVAITSHLRNHDVVQEGEVVVFEAVTDPPGYEDEITWLSSTKYGTASPVLGSGPTFAVQFDDTWGINDRGMPFQWLGVKADNTTINQDQTGTEMWLTTLNNGPDLLSAWDFGMNGRPPIPADFFAPGSDPWTGSIECIGIPLDPDGPSGQADSIVTHEPVVWVPNPDKGPPEIPAQSTFLASLTALTEESTEPILVTYNGGQTPEQWSVTAILAVDHPGGGDITITSIAPDGNGGMCDIQIAVKVDFFFEALPPASHPGVVLSPPAEFLSETDHAFLRTVDSALLGSYAIPPGANGNFVPSVTIVGQAAVALASKSCNAATRHSFSLTPAGLPESLGDPSGTCP